MSGNKSSQSSICVSLLGCCDGYLLEHSPHLVLYCVHADGTTYVDAPPNPWADMKREEDARDLVLFTELVEKVGGADHVWVQQTGITSST